MQGSRGHGTGHQLRCRPHMCCCMFSQTLIPTYFIILIHLLAEGCFECVRNLQAHLLLSLNACVVMAGWQS